MKARLEKMSWWSLGFAGLALAMGLLLVTTGTTMADPSDPTAWQITCSAYNTGEPGTDPAKPRCKIGYNGCLKTSPAPDCKVTEDKDKNGNFIGCMAGCTKITP